MVKVLIYELFMVKFVLQQIQKKYENFKMVIFRIKIYYLHYFYLCKVSENNRKTNFTIKSSYINTLTIGIINI